MATFTKQQVREQITKVIQEGILTKVLPYQSINGVFDCSIFNSDGAVCGEFGSICNFNSDTDGCDTVGIPYCYELSADQLVIANANGSTCDDFSVTAQSYQSVVVDGQIQVQQNTSGGQVVIYQEDFQSSENDFNTFVDNVTECYHNGDGTYEEFLITELGMADSSGLEFSLGDSVIGEYTDDNPYITTNITSVLGYSCAAGNLPLKSALIILTQFQSLSNTLTQINPTQAQEILDTTIFELIPQQSSRQQKINQFFTDYSNLKASPPDLITDANGDGVPDEDFTTYDLNNDISETNTGGDIVRLNENAGTVNEDKTLEWLRDDLNTYFLDSTNTTDEGLPTYQERSSGYLKFREMNQAIIIRNTENQQVIPDNWETTGFTITQWVRFKDKVSGGTLFNYGNPLRQNPMGFMLETFVLNAGDTQIANSSTNVDTNSPYYLNWKEYAEYVSLDYFDNNDVARFLRLVVYDSLYENTDGTYGKKFDSHIAIANSGTVPFNGSISKVNTIAAEDPNSPGAVRRLLATTNVPIDFNEWYFIVATYDTSFEQSVSVGANQSLPLYWEGNLNADNTQTHHSGLGNRCKVEIISKTDLLHARGFKQD
tara:strand:- start:1587 stop:3386 length:1800 start_codon:yes stop_codon:yes gene_type:complete